VPAGTVTVYFIPFVALVLSFVITELVGVILALAQLNMVAVASRDTLINNTLYFNIEDNRLLNYDWVKIL
jgi:hypothetical protein